jgi:hypothetical protein
VYDSANLVIFHPRSEVLLHFSDATVGFVSISSFHRLVLLWASSTATPERGNWILTGGLASCLAADKRDVNVEVASEEPRFISPGVDMRHYTHL